VTKPLDDFSTVANLKKILPRGKGGVWIQDKDFQVTFSSFKFSTILTNLNLKNKSKFNIIRISKYTQNMENELLVIEADNDASKDQELNLLFGFKSRNA